MTDRLAQLNQHFARMKKLAEERDDPRLDAYDPDGCIASCAGFCTFCDIVMKTQDKALWYEDEHVMVFEDIFPRARVHALCISKRHIRDIEMLQKGDEKLL